MSFSQPCSSLSGFPQGTADAFQSIATFVGEGSGQTCRPSALRRQLLPRGEALHRCPDTDLERYLALQGFEVTRRPGGTLRHRCPTAAFNRAGHSLRAAKAGEHGRA